MIISDINILKSICDDANLLEAESIIRQLEQELHNSSGIGLAANQIGIKKKYVLLELAE